MTNPTLAERIDEIMALNEKRTQGDWKLGRTRADGYNFTKIISDNEYIATVDISNEKQNAAFIAAAPSMITIIESQQLLLREARDRLNDDHDNHYLVGKLNAALGDKT